MRRQCVIPFPPEAIESTLIIAQINNLLVIRELPAQCQQQKYQKKSDIIHQNNVNSIISMSLLTTLNSTKLPPSTWSRYWLAEFLLLELF